MMRFNVRRDEDGKAVLEEEAVVYDYANQAWIRNGRYERCGHPESMDCRCYGKEHAGEIARTEEN